MNSFQAQFNSLLGLALGAKTFGEKQAKKTLGVPKAPTASANDFSNLQTAYQGSTATNQDYVMATVAKERSLQNLRNRHEALRAVKRARMAEKGELTFKGDN